MAASGLPNPKRAALQKRLAAVYDDDPVTKEIWRLTKEEIGKRLSHPQALDWQDDHPRILTARFGVQQRTSKGGFKIRTIDDFSMSGVNSTITLTDVIRHDHVDDLADVAAAIHHAGHQVVFIKADFKNAYRTVPVMPEHQCFVELVVRDTDTKRWVTIKQWALPFGAIAAVYGWERVGAAITQVLRSMGLPVLRYVDDLFLAVPVEAADAARYALVTVVAALGWTLEPSKTLGPVETMVILGMSVSCTGDGTIDIRPDTDKVKVWVRSIDDALETNKLVSSEAAKLAGRLLFARRAWFGRVGSAQLRRLFQRAHRVGSPVLSPSLRRVLLWWKAMLANHAFYRDVWSRPGWSCVCSQPIRFPVGPLGLIVMIIHFISETQFRFTQPAPVCVGSVLHISGFT